MKRLTIRSLYLAAIVLALTALMWWGTGIAPPSVVNAQSKGGDVPPDRRATPSIIKASPLTNDSASPIAVGSTGGVDPLSPAGPWTVVAPLPSARYGNGGAGDGTFYYSVGGSNISSMLPDVFRYDPVGNAWASRAPIPTAVQDAPVVFAGGKLYVFGGLNSLTNVVSNTTQIYDIAGNTWSTGAPMPDVRFGSYVGLFSGKIYVAGGFPQNDVNTGQNQTWEYNIAGNTWLTKANMPNVNALGSYAVIGQFLYTFAGWRGNPCCDTDSYRYDMANDVWTTIASLPVGLEGTAAALDNGNILIYGGGAPFNAQNTTYVYDPGLNTYSAGPILNQIRARFAGGNVGSFAIAVAGYTGTAVTNITERSAVAISCTLTCPANITQSNDPNQCGAVVTYPAPTTTGTCNTPVCAPASGSFFPVGTTTVTCTSTGNSNGTVTCTFTVTVNDTQPPTIICPANVTAVAPQTCPLSSTATVTFPPPTVSDNCPGVTFVCTPPSGSVLPVGTTTVTCTATDASGNTATCSFTVTVFSGCLQDDSNPANVVLFNAATGEYRFCCNGTVFTGVGTVIVKGCIVTIQHYPADRRVLIKFDGGASAGTATLQYPPGVLKCTITDRNTKNNTCVCQ